ncbi:MAG TPA: phosphopantetheine-binding protein [Oscillospiraceae bacterium]|jgi:acyl carrier protein|nr:phosphopantetheine-binding protein [Oscillospiraceae bacterium]
MVLERVISLIASQFCLEEDELSEDTELESLGADEEDIEDLITALEGEFEITFHEDEISRLNDIADLVEIVEKAINLPDLD